MNATPLRTGVRPVWLLLLLPVLLWSGCAPAPDPVDLAHNTLILGDHSDSGWDRTYLIENTKMVLIVVPAPLAMFPNAQDLRPRYYLLEQPTPELLHTVKMLSGVPGDAKPPFKPNDPVYWRAVYPHAQPGQPRPEPTNSYFSASEQLKTGFSALHTALETAPHLAVGLPDWAFQNEDVVHRLGMAGK
ncbi:MAG: hypothetical protein ACREJ2_16505 [Planctomycetota bacterium]